MQQMAMLSHTTEPVGSESLEKWESVGSGGFGHVYKARHRDWGFDVAIKLLHDGVGFYSSAPIHKEKALAEEASHMDKVSCEFVLRVYGLYEGIPPLGGLAMQKGIVMEFMGGGSVQALLQDLSGPPPWPLVFRLAHQVALGMNFLHSRNLMHHDLKPSNVLLNDEFNAKLADFGLSRVSTSALNSNNEMTGEAGGTYKYMPPEAFEASYEPVRAFDRYSYGILLWSIVTGKEPYPKCLEVTEKVFSKHKKEIHGAVHLVLTRLESHTRYQHLNTRVPFSFSPETPESSKSHETMDHVRVTETKKAPTPESVSVSTKTMSDTDKAKFIDDNRAVLIQDVSEVMAIVDELGDMVHSETYSAIEAKQTSQEKMRALFLETFRPGGVTVKAAFYTVLKRHHPRLVERLGG
ncbi:receptor-interacting serine/threonine-protein kinase 3 isoform X3 [Scophthalmus maximus]|uniref:receptor-interacting serine/threonine-protein kinase 3 isoform X3 n=1 Tax=Scophthalmus maximus TaxID=52904 RepID=UPI0015E13EE8|nr:receptor-interacting serine/threonine-protein kinase 3 isoform X3 [Scophthalmus maximus]